MRWDLYTSAEEMQVLWVCIGLPVLLLAAWLVRDWMDAGGSKKARKAAKALGSKTDEMEHAISIQAQAVAYRVTQAGIQVCLYYRLLVKDRRQWSCVRCWSCPAWRRRLLYLCRRSAKQRVMRSIRRDWLSLSQS